MIPSLVGRWRLALAPQLGCLSGGLIPENRNFLFGLSAIEIYIRLRPTEYTIPPRGPRLRAALAEVVATHCHQSPKPDSSDTAACRSIWGISWVAVFYRAGSDSAVNRAGLGPATGLMRPAQSRTDCKHGFGLVVGRLVELAIIHSGVRAQEGAPARLRKPSGPGSRRCRVGKQLEFADPMGKTVLTDPDPMLFRTEEPS